jgi:hypothetical protein
MFEGLSIGVEGCLWEEIQINTKNPITSAITTGFFFNLSLMLDLSKTGFTGGLGGDEGEPVAAEPKAIPQLGQKVTDPSSR